MSETRHKVVMSNSLWQQSRKSALTKSTKRRKFKIGKRNGHGKSKNGHGNVMKSYFVKSVGTLCLHFLGFILLETFVLKQSPSFPFRVVSRKFKVERFPGKIARYTMIKHGRDHGNPYNKHR